MIAGLSGALLSHDALARMSCEETAGTRVLQPRPGQVGGVRLLYAATTRRLGPAASARQVFDELAEPFARLLGYAVVPVRHTGEAVDALLQSQGTAAAALVASAWGESAAAAWRRSVHLALAHGCRWALCANGPSIRLYDADRAYSRRYAEFDIGRAAACERASGVMCALLDAHMLGAAPGAGLHRLLAATEQHRLEVSRSLRDGVYDALLGFVGAFRKAAARRHSDEQLLHESLTLVYRILFLLFAEARGLVPSWHPVYREAYAIEGLRNQLDPPGSPRGIWEALQAIARLAHRGCRAGPLRVPPFNGRLFSPANAPLADTLPLDDLAVSRALMVLTTRKGGAQRISYGDLGVEQLGSVYEHLLDYDLARPTAAGAATLVRGGRRKATGSFYTPRTLTEFLVRRTLAPLVHDATAEQVLRLRLVDPAMGSGAFLVAACRYLGDAYAQALVRDGACAAADLEGEDFAAFRRLVAQRCLYGVDVNPMAVQLGRLSLWLATMARDKPLTFLDHHLRTGDALVGASIENLLDQPHAGRRCTPHRATPLLEELDGRGMLENAVASRARLAMTPDDTLEQVRSKERLLAALAAPGTPLARWRLAADAWCAAWDADGPVRGRPAFRALLDHLLGRVDAIPPGLAANLLSRTARVAAERRYFHWPLEFPEQYYDASGHPLAEPGFDVVFSNPPWEMLRHDGSAPARSALVSFVRGAGLYPLQGRGHGNLYQLFLERSLRLLRRGGRCGLILPGGFASDHGAGPLRRTLFDRTSIDTWTIVDNKDGVFPIHRSVRFLLMTCGAATRHPELPVRSGVRDVGTLERIPDQGAGPGVVPLPLRLVETIGGSSMAVPDVRSPTDVAIVSALSERAPALGSPDGWHVRFGRELNATDDRPHFSEGPAGLPVLEGKHLYPFRVDVPSTRFRIAKRAAERLLRSAPFERARLGYREVAAATNRTTLIAAVIPRGVVTSHTVFCLKEPLDLDSQLFLCGVFNSYTANYLVRLWVGTHVTAAIMERLPLPKPPPCDAAYLRITRLSRSLSRGPDEETLSRLNALVARMYGLSSAEYAHVLDSFPLVPAVERDRSLRFLASD